MRKLRNLIGIPVIFQRRKIGRLIQAELSGDLSRLEGIWIDAGLRGTRYIPSEHLGLIGESVVLTDSRGIRKRAGSSALLRRAVSTDGRRVGAIVGADVDEISFLVCALELSLGFWDDLWFGRRQIKIYNARETQVIVPDSTMDRDKEEEG